MSRRVATALALAALRSLFAFGCLELAFRVAPNGYLPCVDKSPGVWTADPLLGWFHVPRRRSWGQSCLGNRLYEWRTAQEINGLGLNDRERTYAKPPGTYRVLVIGDSYTEGIAVRHDETFAGRLERELRVPGAAGVEVLNAGVAAWSTDNELLFWRNEGVRYTPDLVLLAFTPENDVGENVPQLVGADFARPHKPTFTLEGGRLVLHDSPMPMPPPIGPLTHLDERLMRHSYAYPPVKNLLLDLGRTVSAAVARADGRPASPVKIPAEVGFALEPLPPEWAAAWELTQHLVRQLRSEVEASGARFGAIVVPSKIEVGGPRINVLGWPPELDVRFEREGERAAAFFGAEGIYTCPLLAALRAHLAATGRNGYFMWDIHLNPEGHQVVASELAACLARMPGLAATRR